MALQFRNVDATPDDDVRSWPFEALVTAIDRGLVPDWQPIFAEVRRSPWGLVARRIERYLEVRDHDGAGQLFHMAVERARADHEREAREQVATKVQAAVSRSGMSKTEFAQHVGTSGSRLSTYLSGKVTPSAAMLLRIERLAEESAASPKRPTAQRPRGDSNTRHTV